MGEETCLQITHQLVPFLGRPQGNKLGLNEYLSDSLRVSLSCWHTSEGTKKTTWSCSKLDKLQPAAWNLKLYYYHGRRGIWITAEAGILLWPLVSDVTFFLRVYNVFKWCSCHLGAVMSFQQQCWNRIYNPKKPTFSSSQQFTCPVVLQHRCALINFAI